MEDWTTKAKFIVFRHDDKALGAIAGVGADGELIVGDGEGFGWVHDGDDTIVCASLGEELGRDFVVLALILTVAVSFVVGALYKPF